jgi:hypothetical protein
MKYVNDTELKQRIETGFNHIFSAYLTGVGRLAATKIAAILDEIDHLLIDYAPRVEQMQLPTDKVMRAAFADLNDAAFVELMNNMSRGKLQKAALMMQNERKQYIDNLKLLKQVTLRNRLYLESTSEEAQDKMAQVAEMVLDQMEMRQKSLIPEERIPVLVRSRIKEIYREADNFSHKEASELSKKASLRPETISKMVTGEMEGVDSRQVIKLLAALGLKATLTYEISA